MGKTLDTLSEDVYSLLEGESSHDSKVAAGHAMNIGIELGYAIERVDKPREKGKLWASDIGKPCHRQQWYRFNGLKGEEIKGHTRFKFLYGNILEESALYLAKEAGHTVEYEQERVELEVDGWKITGKIDAVVDRVLTDVKSTSPYGFKNYKDHYSLDATNDNFGYLFQLGFYHRFASNDIVFDRHEDPAFIWVDKQNGHIKPSYVAVPSAMVIKARIKDIIEYVDMKEHHVPKAFEPEPYGKSGNMKLPTACSYCPFKKTCWRDANSGKGLRTFLYSHGPVHFTEINREPSSKVPEITDDA